MAATDIQLLLTAYGYLFLMEKARIENISSALLVEKAPIKEKENKYGLLSSAKPGMKLLSSDMVALNGFRKSGKRLSVFKDLSSSEPAQLASLRGTGNPQGFPARSAGVDVAKPGVVSGTEVNAVLKRNKAPPGQVSSVDTRKCYKYQEVADILTKNRATASGEKHNRILIELFGFVSVVSADWMHGSYDSRSHVNRVGFRLLGIKSLDLEEHPEFSKKVEYDEKDEPRVTCQKIAAFISQHPIDFISKENNQEESPEMIRVDVACHLRAGNKKFYRISPYFTSVGNTSDKIDAWKSGTTSWEWQGIRLESQNLLSKQTN